MQEFIISEEIDNQLKPKRFATFHNTLKLYKHVFPTENSLRYFVFNSKVNGLDDVISKIGKKLIFDLDKLEQWISTGADFVKIKKKNSS